ncbi:MAG: DUF3857 domain-containing protein [Saprospiraceae bacterium]|nr:DUF3857 domain-containing protein [Saprospiraceae bacterium]
MKFYSTLFLVSISYVLIAQELMIHTIPQELCNNAHAVLRNYEGRFEVKAIDKAIYTEHRTITILSKEARLSGDFIAFYDQSSKIRQIDYRIYNQHGQLIHKANKKEIKDQAAISNATIYSDNRVKYYQAPEQITYPYTVELSYNIEYNNTFQFPRWFFLLNENIALEYSSFEFEYPKVLKGRYKEHNFKGKTTKSSTSTSERIKWELQNQVAKKSEPYGAALEEILPSIQLAPSQFKFDDYTGDLSTWQGFATWIHELNQELDPLPEEFKKELKLLTKGKNSLEKTKFIYQYLQDNSRYVSVQLGIGGFQPFSPATVHKHGYGDCKALTYYTKSMLEAVGVQAHYSLVYAGNIPNKIDKDFPSNQFNHVILLVPLSYDNQLDTVWLECTSQTQTFAYLGSFTANREAFVIHNNGKLEWKQTSNYQCQDNQTISKTTIRFDKELNAKIDIEKHTKALSTDALSGLQFLSKQKQGETIKSYLDLPKAQVQSIDLYTQHSEHFGLKAVLSSNNLLNKIGTSYTLIPNICSRHSFIPPNHKNRSQAIHLHIGYEQIDSVEIQIPPQMSIEGLFEPIQLDYIFGSYQAKIKQLANGNLLYTRNLLVKNGIFEATNYKDFLHFFKTVTHSDRKKMILILTEP